MPKNIFSQFMEEPEQKPPPPKKKGISKETKDKVLTVIDQNVRKEKEKPAVRINHDSLDLPDLIEQSSRSELMKPIQLEELQRFKIEQSKMSLLKNAGELAEVEFMKFVYLGYMEKVSIDMLRMTKKLENRIKAFVEEGDSKGLTKLIDKEVSLVLATVKKNQKEDLKRWEKDMKRGKK